MNTRQKCECQEGILPAFQITWSQSSLTGARKSNWSECDWWNLEGSSQTSFSLSLFLFLSLSLSLSLTHTHTHRKTHRHIHTRVCPSQAQVFWEQGQLSYRLSYLAPCQRVFTEKATIQTCCLGLLWPVIGKGGSSQEENKNHKKKIFKCFFIILSGLFKMTSIYGNEPLNEAS